MLIHITNTLQGINVFILIIARFVYNIITEFKIIISTHDQSTFICLLACSSLNKTFFFFQENNVRLSAHMLTYI